ncbi:hypothetical protein KUCAC02_030956 [Chaenocephalus aceratus]|uniref:Uncharacterized protein n=1 Tax=Chaenocephalus aceratus TaxID=36190 RepID=A0ACB9XLQ5_CHAAC|nr:hypothetical protein KUCAC02_030956 [Chaenocephalus aceratus]
MERDNHQVGETEGVKICDPPCESNPPADTLATSLSLLGNHMFPYPLERKHRSAVKEEPADSLSDVTAEEESLDGEPHSHQVTPLETEETDSSECQNNVSSQQLDIENEDTATDNERSDSGEFVATMLAKAKLEEQGLGKGPLVLVCVSSSRQTEKQLRGELLYVYYQIISMLTQASISRIFEHKKNYDLRRLLAGSEKILDGLLNLVDSDPSFLLVAVQCLPLASSLRDNISQILQKAITPNLVFSILIANNRLLTIVQEKTVIEDSRMHCCLLLLSTDKEAFYAVAECKRKIEEAMMAQNSLSLIAKVQSYSVSQVGVSDLRHFIPEMEAPYSSEEEKMRLLDLYRYMHSRIHSTSRPLKLIYHVAERETLLAWYVTNTPQSIQPPRIPARALEVVKSDQQDSTDNGFLSLL